MEEKYSPHVARKVAKNSRFLTNQNTSVNYSIFPSEMGRNLSFKKSERLSDVRLINAIFNREGQTIKRSFLLLVFLPAELNSEFPAQALFSVSKKKFSKAHQRNRIKRMMKEAYRLNKNDLYEVLRKDNLQFSLAFINLGDEICTYQEMEKQVILALHDLIKKHS
jgi:ribonuclease P protein component